MLKVKCDSKETDMKRSSRLILAMAGLALAWPVLADPPSHAPAHGWRKKHDPYYEGYSGRKWPSDYGVSDGRCNRDAIGAVLGGAAGAVIGSQVVKGDGQAVATLIGGVLGAAIGHEIGENMDREDRACWGHTLELAKTGSSVRWTDAAGVQFVLTPTRDFVRSGAPCRDYNANVRTGGKSKKLKGTACRAGDGTWRMM
jgi:surface antigen